MWYCVVRQTRIPPTYQINEKGEHIMRTITGRLAEKAGKWYAVINLYTPEGKQLYEAHNLDAFK